MPVIPKSIIAKPVSWRWFGKVCPRNTKPNKTVKITSNDCVASTVAKVSIFQAAMAVAWKNSTVAITPDDNATLNVLTSVP